MTQIKPVTYPDMDSDLRWRMSTAVDRAIAEITTTLYGAPDDRVDVFEMPHAQQRDYYLGRLAAVESLTEYLRHEAHIAAHIAGHLEDAPATYADLAAAAGLGHRQSARDRWPGAVADAKPGRPRRSVDPEPVPLPEGLVPATPVEHHRLNGHPFTAVVGAPGMQVGDWVYVGDVPEGAEPCPRETTAIENIGSGNWEITTADGEVHRVRWSRDLHIIRPATTDTEEA